MLFGHGQKPAELAGVKLTQSKQGMPVPTVYGIDQVEQCLVWEDGFVSTPIKGTSKGKEGGSQWDYTVNVIAALCNGPVLQLGDVWSSNSWMGLPISLETITVPAGGSPTYTPTYVPVTPIIIYIGRVISGTYNDAGAPSSTVLSGTDSVPMVQLPFGSTLTTGTYSIDGTGVVHYSTADAGATVTHTYKHNTITGLKSEIDIIPAGLTVQVGASGTGQGSWAQFPNYLQTGIQTIVTYATGVNQGKQFTQVGSAPSAAATFQVVNNSPSTGFATYHFASADLAQEIQIVYAVNDATGVPNGVSSLLQYTLYTGAQGQTTDPGLTSHYPGAALGYSNTAYVLFWPMQLYTSGSIQQNRFEVVSPITYGGAVYDANPIQCITDILTNTVYGLGSGVTPFPAGVIDNGAGGTWGFPSVTAGARVINTTAWNWFSANSFFISQTIDGQDTASSLMGKWLEAGSCSAFLSEGLLKLVPKGDTSCAGNGCTWTAPQFYIVALDDTCFVGKDGEDPVKIEIADPADAYNTAQVSWKNRANQYGTELTQEWDTAAINQYGNRIEDPQNYDFIKTLTAAQFAASMRVKRSVYIRNKYSFTLPFSYEYLEPMDVITISTTSAWALGLNNGLGILNLPIRITKIVDDPTNGLQIEAEDYPWGTHQPTIFNKAISSADTVVNKYADPGSAEVVMFEAPNRLTKQQGNQIWIGAQGTSDNYGGVNVFASSDGGSTYLQIGTIKSVARMGALASTFPSGADADTVNSCVVLMAENAQALDSGSSTDADNLSLLAFVDGEIISYSAAAVTGQNQFTLNTYIRRGQMGTSISSHAAGGLFMRLDDTIWTYTYDPVWAGQTLLFKFQPFNGFNNMAPALSTLTPVSFTVPGKNPGTIDASSGLVLQANYTGTGHGPLAWSPVYTSPYVASLNIGASAYSYAGMNTTYASGVAAIVAGGYQYFYNRFTGYLVPTYTGEYTIGLNSDDGANLYIGGQLVGTDNLSTVRGMGANLTYSSGSSASILLTAGVYYPIVVEWEQNTGNWGLQLLWTLPAQAGGTTQIIPVGNLSISNTSVTSSLNLSIWQGSSGLWYPSGVGLIDPANKTLYGPPNAGGGTNVVNSIITSTNHLDVFGVAGNTFTAPGWIVGQLWSSGSQMVVIVPSASTLNHGYIFNFGMNNGSEQCYIVSYSGTTGATGATQTPATRVTYYAATNPALFTGWWNFAIYIGANGYMAAWVNGNLATDAVDVTYAMGTQAIYYCQQAGWANTFKIAPAPLGTSGGSSFLNGQASIVPTQPIALLSYGTVKSSGTNGQINLTWSATTMSLSDGSTMSIPLGSKNYINLAVATYYVYPYVDFATSTIKFANPDPPTTAASATYAIAASLDGRYALPPQAIVVASGTGAGGGLSGGTSCPETNELVDVEGKGKIPVGQVEHGDMIKGYSFKTNADVYRRVVNVRTAAAAAWRIIDNHKVSPCEPVWKNGGYTPAYQVPGATHDASVSVKVMLHVDIDDYDEANFWLVSGEPLLIHNQFIGS